MNGRFYSCKFVVGGVKVVPRIKYPVSQSKGSVFAQRKQWNRKKSGAHHTLGSKGGGDVDHHRLLLNSFDWIEFWHLLTIRPTGKEEEEVLGWCINRSKCNRRSCQYIIFKMRFQLSAIRGKSGRKTFLNLTPSASSHPRKLLCKRRIRKRLSSVPSTGVDEVDMTGT